MCVCWDFARQHSTSRDETHMSAGSVVFSVDPVCHSQVMELAGSHGDPENVEQMKETKRDIEHKVEKILKLIQNNGPAKKGKIPEDSKKRSALIELVEDFHEQYQSLYAQCDYLRAELGKKAPGRKEKESSPSSSFSDSEYYSPDIGGSPMIDILLETSDGTAGELDSANLEASGLKHRRKEASAQAKGLKNRINNLQKELDSLRCEKSHLEAQLNMKTKEVAENLLRTETLEGEITRKAITEQELLKERETFHAHRKDLELEADSIRNQKNRLEELIRSKNQETDQLRQEGERMHARIFELEGILLDRGNSFSPCQKEFESGENEATTQIMALKSQIFSLQQDLDSLLSEKSLLETQNERLRRDVMQIQFQMENEVQNLTSEIEEQQKILKDKEDTIKRLTEETKVVRHRSLDSPKYRSLDSPKYRSLDSPRTNPQSLERKIEELAGSFHMKMENHIRILYQRILVAEQIHAETKDSYKKMKDRLDQENIELIEKTTAFEAEFRKIREMLLETGEIFSGAETALKKFYEDNENLSDPIGRISNELQFAKRWITETKDEIKKLKHNVDSLTVQLNGKEEKEFLLREKVWKLEATLSKEGGEKLNSVSQLERKVVYLEQQVKQKEDNLLGVSEEKREAIRQLCMMVDYHRGRYDHLREAISKKTVHIRRMA
ncbi:MYOSIN HEAVY CHAIN-LIKE PROTEIN [Salix koriyanagi]|uniref:MYOSIN HEAVY CHAIN-LIKE PROTEIN n=1 Tax=Salix koriyanagi TaxID=2511006 RepID=A0A9Q0PVS3_9ROSI|nr:MYOSIN HEAVY CHAIN-LIKE PROTEIN [Salix koriyanagi]